MRLYHSTTRPPGHPNLEDYADADLLDFAAMRGEDLTDEDTALAEEAFAELYRRHADGLFQILRTSIEGHLYEYDGSQNLESLVGETFLHACKSAETYDPKKSRVKTWLVRIAKNLINSWLRKEKRRLVGSSRVDTEGEEEELDRVALLALREADVDTSRFDKEEIQVVRDALAEAITEHQWKHLTAYLAVQAKGETHGRADRGAVQRLAEILGTTTNALRANKSRAISNIQKYIREHMPERVPD